MHSHTGLKFADNVRQFSGARRLTRLCCSSSSFSCSDTAHTLHASTKVKKIEAPLGIEVQIVRVRSVAACYDSLVEGLEVNTTTRHSYLLSRAAWPS